MNDNFRILKPFLRGLPIVVLVTLFSVVAAKKYLSYVSPVYESTAKLKLADINEGVPASNLFKNLDVFASSNKIATEIEVLKSNILIERTLKQLDFNTEIFRVGDVRSVELYHNSPFTASVSLNSDKGYDKKYRITVLNHKQYRLTENNQDSSYEGTFGKPLKIKYGHILLSLNDSLLDSRADFKLADNYEVEFFSTQKLIQKILKELDVMPVDKDVPIIRISIRNVVPEKAAAFVNCLAQNYIYDYIESKYKAANSTVNFLNDRITDISGKLSNSELGIEDYRNNKKIVNLRQETETELRKISQLKIQETNLKMNLEAIERLCNYIDEGKGDFLSLAPNFEAFTDLLSTEMVKSIKKLQAEKKDLLLTFTANDEKVKVIDAKIKDLSDYLIESIHNTRDNLEIKLEELSDDIESSESAFASVPEKERMLNVMNRDFELYQSSYNFLNEKKIEAEIVQSARLAFHRVITPALVSKTPVAPIRSIIIIFSALLSFIGSVTIIYLVHFAKAKVNDVYTLENKSTIPVALTTPFITEPSLIKQHFLKEVIQLEIKGILKSKSKIAITSYDSSLQHAFHSIHLTNALAMQGRKVLLIDATGTLPGNQLRGENITYLNL
ncbi:MAG: hypothetical protein IT236_12050, partial [Bacteroidia bacterium]|nr:hypothetical protein [Bacteroidia bacterium]